VNDNVWRHFAWSIDPNGDWKFYLNNSLIHTESAALYPDATTRTLNYIGKSHWESINDPYFNGAIDDFRVFNKVLTDTDISGVFYQTYTPVYSFYRFDYVNKSFRTMFTVPGADTFAGSRQIRAFYVTDLSNMILLTYGGSLYYSRNAGTTWTNGVISDYGITSSLYNNITTVNNNATMFNILGQGVYKFDNLQTDFTSGEWLELESDAFKQRINAYALIAPSNNVKMPISWYFLGSRDNISWTVIHQVTLDTSGSIIDPNEELNYTVPSSAYKYYRLLMTTTKNTDSVNMGEFRILYKIGRAHV
jgi:hypothetical protein